MEIRVSHVQKRIARAAASAAALLLVLSSVASAQAAARVSIDNFARVDANYFRGSQPVGHDYADLHALGVKTVIDLTDDDGRADERSMVTAAGMTYVHIPMTTHTAPTAAELRQFFSVVNDSQKQPVYVHCVGGSHRTGVMTAVYRMANDHWAADRAFAEMKTFKFGPDFLHSEFKNFVLAYRIDASLALPAIATKPVS
jgi:protein tyrosine/serine phosphatase